MKAEEDAESVVHELVDDVTTVGRGDENIIVVDDDECSRRHCKIRRDGDDYRLHDLGSRNGTLVNGVPVTRQALRNGDVIAIGEATLLFLEASRQSDARRARQTRRGTTRREQPLGKLLLGTGAVSNEDIEEALATQIRYGGLLGQILRRKGACSDEEVLSALLKQARVGRIDLGQLAIPPEVASLVPRGLCERLRLIPFELIPSEPGRKEWLCVAMVNVLDFEVWRLVREETGREIKVFSSAASDIQQAIERWYPGGDEGGGSEGSAAEPLGSGASSSPSRDAESHAPGSSDDDEDRRDSETPPPGASEPAGRAVFISYRREAGSETARLVRDALAARGCQAFLDVEDLRASRFDERLLREIESAAGFIVILTPGALDRCCDEDDWFLREIAHAIETGRNIIPVVKEGFSFPPRAELPPVIAALPRYNGVEYSHAYFDAAMDRLVSYLKTAPERA